MAIENLYVPNEYKTLNYSSDINYYLDLGRRAYDNFIINAVECDLDIAINSYERVLEIDSTHAEAYYRLAGLLWEKGTIDIECAITQCEKAIELAPNNIDARLYLGYFFKSAGFVEEAISQFKEAIKINFFNSAKPRIALGLSMIQKARKNSTKMYEALTGLAHFILGVFLLVNDQKALELISRSVKEELKVLGFTSKGKLFEAIKQTKSALKVYEYALHKVSRKEVFYEIIADIHKQNQSFIFAAEYYRKAIKMNTEEPKTYQKLISVLDEEIDTKEIINCYKELCRLEPDNHLNYYQLGHIYLEDRNYFGAIDCIRRAIQADPNNPYYHNSLAYALVQLEDYDGALNQYQLAISLNSDKTWTSIVCQAVGAIYYQAKDNADAAIMSYLMALDHDPTCVDTLVSLAEIYYDKGNFEGAISCYEKALKFDNKNAQAHCNLGFVYWENNQVNKAIAHYQLAISLLPTYDIAYNNLGVAYIDALNKPSLALALFEMAIKSNLNYALAYYNKGRALEMLNRKPEAADYYQMALDINTFTQEIDPEVIEKRLTQLFKVD